jgi:hypothetical protein
MVDIGMSKGMHDAMGALKVAQTGHKVWTSLQPDLRGVIDRVYGAGKAWPPAAHMRIQRSGEQGEQEGGGVQKANLPYYRRFEKRG